MILLLIQCHRYYNDEYIGGFTELDIYLKPEYDYEKLKQVSKIICYNLNKIIDINYYPTPETKYSNLKHRPIGIGIQGLADLLSIMRYNFSSDEAIELDKNIMETIYYGALEQSMELAKEKEEKIKKYLDINNPYEGEDLFKFKIIEYEQDNDNNEYLKENYYQFDKDISRSKYIGAYSTFVGSPLSKGIFQFDMCNIKPTSRWDWEN